VSFPQNVIRAVIQNGVAVLEEGAKLPDGMRVNLIICDEQPAHVMEMTDEERAEYEEWDRLSNEAWAKIDRMLEEPNP
jgi:predicted DNA-binding antitoxin AbrB/MazE fold protein